MRIKMLKDEYWYGGTTALGCMCPIGKNRIYSCNINQPMLDNQVNTLFVSNKGRYIWSDKGYKIVFFLGNIFISQERAKIVVGEGYGDLKGAFLASSKKHFPCDGKYPNEKMFRGPQFCTWIELDTNQTQEGILNYAQSIVDKGLPVGEIILDDGWQRAFGDWYFDEKKIPDPKGMVTKLQEMGFDVCLWIVPFVSTKAPDYAMLAKENMLVRDKNGVVAMRKWWNGLDAVLDLSNPKSMEYFQKQADRLIADYGISGLKQDAGDINFYRDDDITFGNVDATEQCKLWSLSARGYDFNELRACFQCGGLGIAQRLSDKSHNWSKIVGLRALVPNALLQGIMGYPYLCPDMIGGGQIKDFRNISQDKYDHELFARSLECSALMPMMQFSLSLWNSSNKTTAELTIKYTKLHETFANYIIENAKHASMTNEPIIRYMEYEYPNQGFHKITNVFALGSKYIVAPIDKKGQRTKQLKLPKGTWLNHIDKKTYEGGKTYTFDVALEQLLYLEKVEK